MPEQSGFFNSIDDDRMYSAEDFAGYFGELVTSGIFYKNADILRVSAAGGMNIYVAPGSAFINGYNYRNSENLILPLEIGDNTNPRIDRIVVRWDLSERRIYAAILKGVPSNNPIPIALTRSADTYELCLANVQIARSATSISAANITDTRLDSALCGEINSKVRAVYD